MTALVWAANILGWPIIHLGTAWIFLTLPAGSFSRDNFIFKARAWERDGAVYRHWFVISRWKSWLPDGAPWMGGMSKKRVARRDPDYLFAFLLETRRAEFAHWCMIACLPVFLPWNPWWARIVMAIYAIGANVPCILAQRYNRLILARLLKTLEARSRSGRDSGLTGMASQKTFHCPTDR